MYIVLVHVDNVVLLHVDNVLPVHVVLIHEDIDDLDLCMIRYLHQMMYYDQLIAMFL